MTDKEFWDSYELPVQDEDDLFDLDIEEINPAEAYRRQADAINLSGPIFAELETLRAQLARVKSVEDELKTRILAQNMPVKSSSTRTSDLIEGFILAKAKEFRMPDGEIRDVSENLLRLKRRRNRLENEIDKRVKRISALDSMAEKCSRILNWAKFEARIDMEMTR